MFLGRKFLMFSSSFPSSGFFFTLCFHLSLSFWKISWNVNNPWLSIFNNNKRSSKEFLGISVCTEEICELGDFFAGCIGSQWSLDFEVEPKSHYLEFSEGICLAANIMGVSKVRSTHHSVFSLSFNFFTCCLPVGLEISEFSASSLNSQEIKSPFSCSGRRLDIQMVHNCLPD